MHKVNGGTDYKNFKGICLRNFAIMHILNWKKYYTHIFALFKNCNYKLKTFANWQYPNIESLLKIIFSYLQFRCQHWISSDIGRVQEPCLLWALYWEKCPRWCWNHAGQVFCGILHRTVWIEIETLPIRSKEACFKHGNGSRHMYANYAKW